MKDGLFIYIEDHVTLLLYSVVFGLLSALIYDAVRMVRTFLGCGIPYSDKTASIKLPLIGSKEKRKKRRFTEKLSELFLAVFDLLYMTALSCAAMIFFYTLSDGVVRWFAIFGAGFGFFAYMKTVGAVTEKFAGIILFTFETAFSYIVYFTVTPIRYIYGRTLKKLYISVCKKISDKKQRDYILKRLPVITSEITAEINSRE